MVQKLQNSKRLTFAFTGPESSGKTSISKKIATRFDALWFPEYAREYLTLKEGDYNFDEIEVIAREQENRRALSQLKDINVYDTEALVLYVWSMFKYERCSPFIVELLKAQSFDYFFLCSPEGISWEEDPLREHPQQRNELFEIYLKKLEELEVNFCVLKGTESERLILANKIISNFLVTPY